MLCVFLSFLTQLSLLFFLKLIVKIRALTHSPWKLNLQPPADSPTKLQLKDHINDKQISSIVFMYLLVMLPGGKTVPFLLAFNLCSRLGPLVRYVFLRLLTLVHRV